MIIISLRHITTMRAGRLHATMPRRRRRHSLMIIRPLFQAGSNWRRPAFDMTACTMLDGRVSIRHARFAPPQFYRDDIFDTAGAKFRPPPAFAQVIAFAST